MIRVSTRRGVVELSARQDDAVPGGVVFIPFGFVEAGHKSMIRLSRA
jgi:formate dehydrogenase major subunit